MDFRAHDTQVAGEIREQELAGRSHLVAPVVLVKEGVLNNALVTNEEIARSEPGWNGVPFVVHHPEEDGQYVSANQPGVLNESGVGGIYNVEFAEDVGLRGEAWTDIERAVNLGGDAAQVAEMLATHYLAQEGELEGNDDPPMLEVSTGYFYEPVDETGTFDGNRYKERQTDIMPDHLAALPGGKGACSVEDGCGAPRVNQLMTNDDDSGFSIRRVGERLGILGDDDDDDETEANDGDDCGCAHNGAADADGDGGAPESDGDGSASQAADSQTNDDSDTPMGHDYASLAENSDLSEEQLRDLHDNDEDAFHALESALESNDDGDDDPDGGDGDGDGDDGDDDPAANDADDAVLSEIQSLRDEVQSLKEEKEESKRESAMNTLESKGYDPENYENMDADALATFADDAAPKGGAVNNTPGQGANMLGRGFGDVQGNDGDDDEMDIEDLHHVGAMTAADAEDS